MAITARTPKFASSASANSLTVDKPTGLQVGDFFVVAVGVDAEDHYTVTPPEGFGGGPFGYWVHSARSTNVHGEYYFWKWADAADVAAANFTIGLSVTKPCHAVAAAWTGMDTTEPFYDFSSAYDSGTDHVAACCDIVNDRTPGGSKIISVWFGDEACASVDATTAGVIASKIDSSTFNAGPNTTMSVVEGSIGAAAPFASAVNATGVERTTNVSCNSGHCSWVFKVAGISDRIVTLNKGGKNESYAVGYIRSANADYATARAGSGTLTSGTSDVYCGQDFVSGTTYYVYEGFFQADLRGLGADEVERMILRMTGVTYGITGHTFNERVYVVPDYGTITTADWIDLDDVGTTYPLVAEGKNFSVATPPAANNFVSCVVDVETLLENAVADDVTSFLIVSDRAVAGTAPSGTEYVKHNQYNGLIAYANLSTDLYYVGETAKISSYNTWFAEGIPRAGDLAVVSCLVGSSAVEPATPAGWTLIGHEVDAADKRFSVYYRVLSTDDELYGTLAATFGTDTGVYTGSMMFFTGVEEVPVGSTAHSNADAQTTIVTPTITPTRSTSLLLLLGAGDSPGFATSSFDRDTKVPSVENDNPAWTWATLAVGGAEGLVVGAFSRYGLTTATGAGAMGATETADQVWGYTIEISGEPSLEWGASSIEINDGDAETHHHTVNLVMTPVLSVAGETATPDGMCFSADGDTWSEWEDYAEEREYTLVGGADTYAVYVKFREYYEDEWWESEAASDTIDLAVPGWITALTINDGAESTDTNPVTLGISVFTSEADSPTHMCFSSDGLEWTDWEAFAITKEWTLPGQEDYPEEVHTVYCKVAEEGLESLPFSDDINLAVVWDTSFVVNNGDATTKSRTLRVDITAENTTGTDIGLMILDTEEFNPSDPYLYEPNQPAEDPDHLSVGYTVLSFGDHGLVVLYEDEYENIWVDFAAIEVLKSVAKRRGVLRVHSLVKRSPKRGVKRIAPRVKRK